MKIFMEFPEFGESQFFSCFCHEAVAYYQQTEYDKKLIAWDNTNILNSKLLLFMFIFSNWVY